MGSRSMWIAVLMAAVLTTSVFMLLPPQSLAPLIGLRYPDVRWIDTAALAARMQDASAPQALVLDVRSSEEFEVSHIRGAVRVDPEQPDLDALQLRDDAPIFVYCSVGYRSAAIARQLTAAGSDEVYNLKGGIFAWANEGRPIIRDGERASAVHPYDAIWGRLLRRDLRWAPTR